MHGRVAIYGVILGLSLNHSICTGVHGVGLDPRENIYSRTTWLFSFVSAGGAWSRIAQKELLYDHRAYGRRSNHRLGVFTRPRHATITSIEYRKN